MPLKSLNFGAKRCTAIAKSTKARCGNPSAFGCQTCRVHGARKPSSIKRGIKHPNYRHGMETLDAKSKRRIKLAELREIEADLIAKGRMVKKI